MLSLDKDQKKVSVKWVRYVLPWWMLTEDQFLVCAAMRSLDENVHFAFLTKIRWSSISYVYAMLYLDEVHIEIDF